MSPKARVLHYIKLSRFATDKHSILLDQFISYEENEVLWIRPQGPVPLAWKSPHITSALPFVPIFECPLDGNNQKSAKLFGINRCFSKCTILESCKVWFTSANFTFFVILQFRKTFFKNYPQNVASFQISRFC